MSTRNTFTHGDVSNLAQALAAAPAPERPLSKMEALAKLAPELKAARDRGHTFENLVSMLASRGLETHARSIARAIKDHEALGGSKRGRKPRKTDAGGSVQPAG